MMDSVKMTTADFHSLIVENNTFFNAERMRHQEEQEQIFANYHRKLDYINVAEKKARDEFNEAKSKYYTDVFYYAQCRKEEELNKNRRLAEEKNAWTARNVYLSNARHGIFEQYRAAGGNTEGTSCHIEEDKEKGDSNES